jgi:hypothetical protein
MTRQLLTALASPVLLALFVLYACWSALCWALDWRDA